MSDTTKPRIDAAAARSLALKHKENYRANLLQDVCSHVSEVAAQGEFELPIHTDTANMLWGELQQMGYSIKASRTLLGKKHTLSW